MLINSELTAIDFSLRELVQKIEMENPTLSVLAARQFRYQVTQTPIKISISKPRKYNILEEFILRAALELKPPPTEGELADVLGLDPIFLRSTINTFKDVEILEVNTQDKIIITPQGRKFYQQGFIPQPPEIQEIYLVNDPLVGKMTCHISPLNQKIESELPNLADFVNLENKLIDVTSLTLESFQQLIQESNLGFHLPEEGKVVTSFQVIAPEEILWEVVAVLVTRLDDEIKIQIRRGNEMVNSDQ